MARALSRPHVLLDFDGVMIRDKNLLQYQAKRSAKFVKTHTQLPLKAAEFVNTKYFPHHGHTVLMLNKIFSKSVSLEEYNDYVFDTSNIRRLAITKEIMAHGKAFKPIFDRYETSIFTNAHINWVNHFLDAFDLSPKYVIWPQDLSYLKPHEKAYDYVDQCIHNSRKVFVDDSKVNLVYPQSLKWHTMHYTESDSPEFIKQRLVDIEKTE